MLFKATCPLAFTHVPAPEAPYQSVQMLLLVQHRRTSYCYQHEIAPVTLVLVSLLLVDYFIVSQTSIGIVVSTIEKDLKIYGNERLDFWCQLKHLPPIRTVLCPHWVGASVLQIYLGHFYSPPGLLLYISLTSQLFLTFLLTPAYHFSLFYSELSDHLL